MKRQTLGMQLLAAFLFIPALSSCASVDASREFHQTAADIRERTGSAEVWEPASRADVISAAIDQMFEDGALTVDEAVRVALLSNPGLQASFMQVGIGKAALVSAGLPKNPVLGIGTRFPEGGGLVNLTLSVTQSLIDLLLMPARESAAKARMEIARGQVVRRAVILAGSVEGEVLDLLALQRAKRAAQDSLALAQRSLDLARSRFAAGLSDPVDIALSNSAVLNARRQILVVERNRAVGRATLNALLGVEGRGESWQVSGDLNSALSGPEESGEALVDAALERRMDIAVAQLLVRALSSDLDAAEIAVIKNLTLGFERERAESPPSLNGPTLQTSIPLYSRNEPAIAKQGFRLAAAERNLVQKRIEVAGEVRRAAARARASQELITLFETEILPTAKASVETSRRFWQAGERDILVVLAAQRFLIQQRKLYASTLRKAARARAELDIAMGGPISHGPVETGEER